MGSVNAISMNEFPQLSDNNHNIQNRNSQYRTENKFNNYDSNYNPNYRGRGRGSGTDISCKQGLLAIKVGGLV